MLAIWHCSIVVVVIVVKDSQRSLVCFFLSLNSIDSHGCCMIWEILAGKLSLSNAHGRGLGLFKSNSFWSLKRIKWWMTQTRMVGKLEKLVSNSWVTTFNSLWPLCKMEIADPAFAQVFVIGSRWGFLLHVNLHDHSIGNCCWERRRLEQCTMYDVQCTIY